MALNKEQKQILALKHKVKTGKAKNPWKVKKKIQDIRSNRAWQNFLGQ